MTERRRSRPPSEMKDRLKTFWLGREAIERVRGHVDLLRQPNTKRSERLVAWRSVLRIAQEEYERELAELDALNSTQADPALSLKIMEEE